MIRHRPYVSSSWMAFSLLLILFLGSCAKKKDLTTTGGPANVNYIMSRMEEGKVDYEWFGARINTDADIDGEKRSFKTNLRMRKDSAIWMSISPALGIEVARLMVTPDSIMFLDKWNDQYYIGDHSFLEDRMDIDLDFAMLQDLTIGNPMLFDAEERFKATNDDEGFVLTSKSKRKVRKAAGLRITKKNVAQTEDTLIVDIDEKKYEKVLDKFEEESLILKRYWVDDLRAKVIRTIITDLTDLRSMEADYLEFEEVDGLLIPVKMNYEIIAQGKRVAFNMEYNRIRMDKVYEFPFSIPEKFKRIQ